MTGHEPDLERENMKLGLALFGLFLALAVLTVLVSLAYLALD
jgi:hypothetical protein